MNLNELYLKAIRLIKEDKWHDAHDIVESLDTPMAARIHGLLHKIEGDQWNADYWYARAGQKSPNQTTDQECAAIIDELSSA